MSVPILTTVQFAALEALVNAEHDEGISEWLSSGHELFLHPDGSLTPIGHWAEEKGLVEIAVVRKTGARMLRITADGRAACVQKSRRFPLGNGRDALLLAVDVDEWVAGIVPTGGAPSPNYVSVQPKHATVMEAFEHLIGLVR